MKKILILSILFITYFSLFGQNDTAYIYTYGGIQNDVCNQIKPTYDGGYIMIGTTNSFGDGFNNFYVIKTDSLGNRKWSNTYGGNQVQEGFSVATTFDHGYAFLGFTDSYGAGGYDVFLVKTDSMGNEQWQKTYGGINWDFGYSIQQLADSGFIICGLTYSYGPGNGNAYVIRTDKIGDTIWTRALGGIGYYSVANSVCVHEDSLYFIAGANTAFNNGDTNTFLIEINNKGSLKWDTTYHSNHNNAANSIRGTSDNGFVIYGFTDSIPSSDSITDSHSEIMIQIDSNGKTEWTQIYYNNTFVGTGKDAVECTNGNYLTVGTTFGGGPGNYQMHIQNTLPGGWWRDGLFFEGIGNEQGNSIAYRDKNHFAFAGTTTYGAGLLDVYFVRFTSDSLQTSYNLVKYYYTDTLQSAGIPMLDLQSLDVKVFPNPMVSSATVLVQGEIGEKYLFNLYDETGKWLLQNKMMQLIGHGQYKIVLYKNNLNSGNYIYNVVDIKNGNEVGTGKIVIE